MKKLITIIFLVTSIGALTACSSPKELDVNTLTKSTYDISQQSKEVTLSVNEKSITPETESINLIYTNLSEKDYTYGIEPHLDVKIEGIWYVVPTLENVAWDDIGYLLSSNGSREDTFSTKNYYGQLNAGDYRLVKTLYSNGEPIYVFAEFKIE